MESNKISIIVTTYNCEKYINDCLVSIINQTYKNLEIIVVDDGSTDDTKNILDKIKKTDNRIKVIYKDNGGVSSARNTGLKEANGDFITFVDGDDTLETDMYEQLLQYNEKYDLDIIHCGYNRIIDKKKYSINGTGRIYELNHDEALIYLIGGGLFAGSLWNKLYKRNLFNDLMFNEEISINEDILINFFLFDKVNKSLYIDIPKYNYWVRPNSACSRTDKLKKNLDCLKVATIIRDNSKDRVKKIADKRYLNQFILYYRCVLFDKKNIESKKLKNELKEAYFNYQDKNLKMKLNVILLLYLPRLYKILYFFYNKIRKPNWDV